MGWIAFLLAAVILRQSQSEETLKRWRALNQTGMELTALGQYREADDVFRKALSEAGRLPAGHLARSAAINNVAANCIRLGRYGEAERLFVRLMKDLELSLGVRHRSLAEPLSNLASLQMRTGRTVLAKQLLQRAIGCLDESPTDQERDFALSLRMRIATNLVREGRLSEAEREFQWLLVNWMSPEGLKDANYISLLNNYGDLLIHQRRMADAQGVLEKAMGIASTVLSNDHPRLIAPLANLALVYSSQQQFAKEVEARRRAIEISERSGDRQSWFYGRMLTQQAAAVRKLGQKAESKELLRRAISIMAQAELERPGRHTVDMVELAAGTRRK